MTALAVDLANGNAGRWNIGHIENLPTTVSEHRSIAEKKTAWIKNPRRLRQFIVQKRR
jgi:hypothetical protein